MGTNPADSHAGGGPGARGDPQLSVRRRLRRLPRNRHDRARRRAAAERRLGREGRHGHQFRAAHVAPARASCPPPGEALPDWRQICEVAKRMGFGDAFAYRSPAEIFAEYARLTAIENDGRRDLDLGALADISERGLRRARAVPMAAPRGRGAARDALLRRRRVSITPTARRASSPRPSAARPRRASARFPFVLNTGRIRDQWHTMTRTAKTPRLMAHIGEPFVEIHPEDARAIGVAAADLAEIESAHGRAVLRVVVTERQRRGSLFAPMHWTDQYRLAGARRRARRVRGRPRVRPAGAEDRAGLGAALRGGLARLRRRRAGGSRPRAPIISRSRRVRGGWRAELAGPPRADDWTAFAEEALGLGDDGGNHRLSRRRGRSAPLRCFRRRDLGRRAVRRARASRGRRAPGLPNVSASASRPRIAWGCSPDDPARRRATAGRPSAPASTSAATRSSRPAAQGCATVAAIGARLKAGTNCGSCRGEIARLVGAEAKAPVRSGPMRKAL